METIAFLVIVQLHFSGADMEIGMGIIRTIARCSKTEPVSSSHKRTVNDANVRSNSAENDKIKRNKHKNGKITAEKRQSSLTHNTILSFNYFGRQQISELGANATHRIIATINM